LFSRAGTATSSRSPTSTQAPTPGFDVQLSVSHGTLTLATTSGLSVTGNGTASVDLTGTLANCNTALNGLTYTPTSGYFGSDSLAITSNDHGATGSAARRATATTLRSRSCT
jgi:hypothetical protein